mgnify:CR=1 FL=1
MSHCGTVARRSRDGGIGQTTAQRHPLSRLTPTAPLDAKGSLLNSGTTVGSSPFYVSPPASGGGCGVSPTPRSLRLTARARTSTLSRSFIAPSPRCTRSSCSEMARKDSLKTERLFSLSPALCSYIALCFAHDSSPHHDFAHFPRWKAVPPLLSL